LGYWVEKYILCIFVPILGVTTGFQFPIFLQSGCSFILAWQCAWNKEKGRKEESETVGLKLNIQKTKITASGPITSWQTDGETVSDFILGGSKITADGDCSHEIKRRLILGRKLMTNLDSIFKSRDLPTKVRLVRLWFFQWSCTDVRVGL